MYVIRIRRELLITLSIYLRLDEKWINIKSSPARSGREGEKEYVREMKRKIRFVVDVALGLEGLLIKIL